MNINNFLLKLRGYRNDEDITIEEVRNIIKMNEESILLDVRSPQEYGEGHLNRCH